MVIWGSLTTHAVFPITIVTHLSHAVTRVMNLSLCHCLDVQWSPTFWLPQKGRHCRNYCTNLSDHLQLCDFSLKLWNIFIMQSFHNFMLQLLVIDCNHLCGCSNEAANRHMRAIRSCIRFCPLHTVTTWVMQCDDMQTGLKIVKWLFICVLLAVYCVF